MPDHVPDGRSWPLVSIVTPSYNQASFLEETIRSVLLQGYPNLEYVVIDGGSSDQSVEVLRRYEPWLEYWVSEPDRGQAHAINKGFAYATGQIFAWLNSDDVYEPGALQRIAAHFARNPACKLVYGDGWYIDLDGQKTNRCVWIQPFDRQRYLTFNSILQPAAFWRRSLWESTGPLDARYHYAMDWEWLIRATESTEPHYLPVELARWRIGPEIKTRSGGRARRAEVAEVARRYGGIRQPTYVVYQLDRLAWTLTDRFGGRFLGQGLQRLSAPVRWVVKDKLWKGRYLS
jgi:glycosyltransferase involved in cell wall biosynthesis